MPGKPHCPHQLAGSAGGCHSVQANQFFEWDLVGSACLGKRCKTQATVAVALLLQSGQRPPALKQFLQRRGLAQTSMTRLRAAKQSTAMRIGGTYAV